jgi:hypothetical protein
MGKPDTPIADRFLTIPVGVMNFTYISAQFHGQEVDSADFPTQFPITDF